MHFRRDIGHKVDWTGEDVGQPLFSGGPWMPFCRCPWVYAVSIPPDSDMGVSENRVYSQL